ncbi:MAG: HupE/UreJ family protein, partial [Pseudomonadota bacterium]
MPIYRSSLTSVASVLAATLFVIAAAAPALAHTGEGYGGGFIAGFTHPILGWDHVAAMVAVGLWGAFLGAPAIWILPVIFPLVMALGAVLGIAGIPVPAVETGIALSALVLGLMIVFAVKPPIWVAALIVGAFAIFHGYAHGIELPGTVNAFAYAVGFVISTGLLHLLGIAFGLLVKW